MIEAELKKVHILQIHDCYYKIFPLVYVGFDSEGITLQGPSMMNEEYCYNNDK